MTATTVLRTPLEQALGERLDLDFDTPEPGDYAAWDEHDAAHEEALLEAALAAGEFLYREAVRASVPGMGRDARNPLEAARADWEARERRAARRKGGRQ